jgi:hypothetical protein
MKFETFIHKIIVKCDDAHIQTYYDPFIVCQFKTLPDPAISVCAEFIWCTHNIEKNYFLRKRKTRVRLHQAASGLVHVKSCRFGERLSSRYSVLTDLLKYTCFQEPNKAIMLRV